MFEDGELVLRNDGRLVRIYSSDIVSYTGSLIQIRWRDETDVYYNKDGSWDYPPVKYWFVKSSTLEKVLYQ